MVNPTFTALFSLVGITAAAVSTDNTCGGTKGLTCPGSLCCSQYNWCGVSDDHCGAGCQSKFGRCTTTSSSSTKISPDGTCGGINAYTCTGGSFGNCCSQWGYCGNSDDHCLNGCQSKFGDCSSITVGGKSLRWLKRIYLSIGNVLLKERILWHIKRLLRIWVPDIVLSWNLLGLPCTSMCRHGIKQPDVLH
ncbi:Lectin-C [Colletotrichum tropicale]|nr:Lectin-C [Colletotrichum tropicale]